MDLEKVDLLTEIDSLRRGWQACEARLAAVEAQRDAARAALAGASARAKAISEERDKEVARSNFFEAEGLCCGQQNATLLVERDAARAGEARAVEACSEMENALHGTDLGDHEWDDPIWNALEEMREISRDNSALDWLAQREREAAAKELEGMWSRWCSDESYRPNFRELWRFVSDRAAALRAGKGGE